MSTTRIHTLQQLMDRAFSGSEHALLDNLRSVDEEYWDVVPERGSRPIQEMVHHVGMFKFMYANHGFRAADYDYTEPPATPSPERLATIAAAVEWLRDAHDYLTGCISELSDDAELDEPRMGHWGELVPTYHLVVTMLEHDLYHSGEINRTRALLQDDDEWGGGDPPDAT